MVTGCKGFSHQSYVLSYLTGLCSRAFSSSPCEISTCKVPLQEFLGVGLIHLLFPRFAEPCWSTDLEHVSAHPSSSAGAAADVQVHAKTQQAVVDRVGGTWEICQLSSRVDVPCSCCSCFSNGNWTSKFLWLTVEVRGGCIFCAPHCLVPVFMKKDSCKAPKHVTWSLIVWC